MKDLHEQKERVQQERDRLEVDLKSSELVERRRHEVAIDTETSLA